MQYQYFKSASSSMSLRMELLSGYLFLKLNVISNESKSRTSSRSKLTLVPSLFDRNFLEYILSDDLMHFKLHNILQNMSILYVHCEKT